MPMYYIEGNIRYEGGIVTSGAAIVANTLKSGVIMQNLNSLDLFSS